MKWVELKGKGTINDIWYDLTWDILFFEILKKLIHLYSFLLLFLFNCEKQIEGVDKDKIEYFWVYYYASFIALYHVFKKGRIKSKITRLVYLVF